MAATEDDVFYDVLEKHCKIIESALQSKCNMNQQVREEARQALGLCGVNILYVITDVVFASYIKLHVQIGAQQKVTIYDRDTPIGFKYRKYKLRSDGTFIAELHTMMRFTARDVTWIRPTPQPVPSIPRWDPMSRRFIGSGGRRKMRNNLTIPSQEEPTRPSRRRTWMQDGGMVHRDRPQINGAVLHARDALGINNDAVDQDDGWRNVLFQRQIFRNQHNQHRPNRLSVSLDNLSVND
ncbi:uncharacterized protein LOC118199836 [Stegodyphus dumicola]|uniref:uncharacterized protein LOC118199836 n=1 Tax=Stegodyphus dumicola TaxID=202533 RepID=UPI0015AD996E|nr:uncharacterized protein LOC118199836 [Stegodyphus dumicola]